MQLAQQELRIKRSQVMFESARAELAAGEVDEQRHFRDALMEVRDQLQHGVQQDAWSLIEQSKQHSKRLDKEHHLS